LHYFSFFNASIAAIAFVNLFFVPPKHFAVASLMPHKSKTCRAAPPAFKPWPDFAGFIIILAALNFAPVS
jgi:hypothetical protein